MLAPVILAVLIGQTPTAGQQGHPLKEASSAPNPVKPEQPWPPAGVFRPGGDVTEPKLLEGPKPNYTPESAKAKMATGFAQFESEKVDPTERERLLGLAISSVKDI